ncbi:MAG: hypothetical protein M3Y67_06745 [Pseudomonadota bacterium]|nr:hypothetical protein [Pseudomonadota bacterium]
MNTAILEFGTCRASPDPLEQIGFALGWDYARHRLQPPPPYAEQDSSLRQGLRAGRATFGLRTLEPNRAVRQWLRLRLHAWLRGRSVELFQVTPNYLRQIEVGHCPITRIPLPLDAPLRGDDSIDRVRNDAGYAAGNLAMMSMKANHAKAAHGFRSARQMAERAAACERGAPNPRLPHGVAGLTASQWQRVSTLCSFVEPLCHEEASALPLHVLPPNRLRLFNPAQALQAFVSRQLLVPGWSQRCARFEDLLNGKELKRDFRAFVIALLPRVLAAGALAAPIAVRWAIEDAWANGLVQKRWLAFAGPLGAADCEALVQKAAARRLATTRVEVMDPGLATDGWNLDSRGYVVDENRPDAPARAAASQLTLALLPP